MKNILIIQTAFLGDVILASSLIETIHQGNPTCNIYILVKKGNEQVFENHPFIKKIFIWDKSNHKYFNLIKIIKEVRHIKFDITINLQRFFTSGLLTILSKSGIKMGYSKNPCSFFFNYSVKHTIGNLHEIERNHQFTKYLFDDPIQLMPPKLYPNENDYITINQYLEENYICIAPNSVWFTKQFPAAKWIELINQLSDFTIYLIGGKNDFATNQSILENVHHPKIYNFSGLLSILETAALMKSAILNYVNDSAPLHIASSINAPVVAIYCSTIPAFGFGPLSSKKFIVQKELSCKPCGLHGQKSCPLKHFNCAHTIEIENLLSPLKTLI